MPLPLLPIIGIVADVVLIGVDSFWSSILTDSGSQLEALIQSIRIGASFNDFVSNCWLFLILGFFFLWAGLAIAFPKHRRGSRS